MSHSFQAVLKAAKSYIVGRNKVSENIPRIIHQLWIPPAHLRAIPDDVLPQVRAWKDSHPDFEHRLWTVEEVAANLSAPRAARMMEAVRVSRFEAMKADIMRLYLLAEFGGFWSDLKVRPRRRWLDEYLDNDLVLVEHFRFDQLPDPSGTLTNNLIGSRARNSFIEACIEKAHANIDARLSTSVWHVAGIKIYMDIYSDLCARNAPPPRSRILKSDYVWGEIVELGHGSYSSNHRHWSVREKIESIYLE